MICTNCGHERPEGNYCPQCSFVDLDSLRSIQISPSVTPSRKNSVPPRRPNNSFEKGVRRDPRGVPYLDKSGTPLKMKESFNPRHYSRSQNNIQIRNGGNS